MKETKKRSGTKPKALDSPTLDRKLFDECPEEVNSLNTHKVVLKRSK